MFSEITSVYNAHFAEVAKNRLSLLKITGGKENYLRHATLFSLLRRTSQSCFLSSNCFFQCEHPFSDKTDETGGYN